MPGRATSAAHSRTYNSPTVGACDARTGVRVYRATTAQTLRKGLYLDALVTIHDRLATTMMLFMAVLGAWGVLSYLRGGTLSGNIAGTFLIGQGLVALQVIAGAALYIGGREPANTIHILYGVTAILVLPFAWSYLRDRNQR